MERNIVFMELHTEHRGSEPLGFCILTAYMRQKGYSSSVYSYNYNEMSIADILEVINAETPWIIVLSPVNDNVDFLLKLIKNVKETHPEIIIILDGYFATYNGNELMDKYEGINYIIKGESETTFVELVKCLEVGGAVALVEGVFYRDGINVKETVERPLISDLDTLPWPVREIFQENLARNPLSYARIYASRGCVGSCTFCRVNSFYAKQKDNKWRGRSIKNVVDEIEYLSLNHNIKRYLFEDSSFENPGEIGFDRIEEFSREILQRNLKINFRVFFRAETIIKRPSLLSLLKKAGLVNAFVGFESGNDMDLKLFNKRATFNDNLECIELLHKNNIYISCGFIMFHPYSNFDAIEQNIDFLNKSPIGYLSRYYSTRLQSHKGTRIYNSLLTDQLLYKPHTDSMKADFSYNYLDKRIFWLVNQLAHKYGDFGEYRVLDQEFIDAEFMLQHLEEYKAYGDDIKSIIDNYQVCLRKLEEETKETLVSHMSYLVEMAKTEKLDEIIDWSTMDEKIQMVYSALKSLVINTLIKLRRKKIVLI